MAPERNVIKRPSGDLSVCSLSESRIYEVIVKFHHEGRPLIEAFLVSHMISVKIADTPDSDVMLAYCQFAGDIKTLDEKLAALRQSAMVVLGSDEQKFLDFFVALKEISDFHSPSPDLPRLGVLPRALKSQWMVGFLFAVGLFVIWQGYHFVSGLISRAVNTPPISKPSQSLVVSQWSPYVFPEYHQAWLQVEKANGLSDDMMVRLFRTIKSIEKFSPGHNLRDLTIYPQAIGRALGLIVLKDVRSAEELETLYRTLRAYYGRWRSLPDRPAKGAASLADSGFAFGDTVVLTFYEQLLRKSHRVTTENLIRELRKFHLSSEAVMGKGNE